LSRRDRAVATMESDLNTFRLAAGAIAILAAATSTSLAQQTSAAAKAKPFVAPQPPATVAHPTAASPSAVVAPTRNAIGLPAAGTAANTIGAPHGPGQGGPNINAAKPPTPGATSFHSVAPHTAAAPLTAKGALSGTQMGRPATGAATLGGSATHAPAAVIGRNVSAKH
jgi:hypothetical protein